MIFMENEIKDNKENNMQMKASHKSLLFIVFVVFIFIMIVVYFSFFSKQTPTNNNINQTVNQTVNTTHNTNLLTNTQIKSVLGNGTYFAYSLNKDSTFSSLYNINTLYRFGVPYTNISSGERVDFYGSNSMSEIIVILNESANESYSTTMSNIVKEYRSSLNITYGKYNNFTYSFILTKTNTSKMPSIIIGYYKNYFVFAYSTTTFNGKILETAIIPSLSNDLLNS